MDPINELKPINIIERGRITSIYGWSFVAGSLPEKLAQTNAQSAEKMLSRYSEVNIQSYKESPKVALANANCSGVMYVQIYIDKVE